MPVGTIKRHIAGKGNADKAAVIDAVRGWASQPADDNEADALALLTWAMAHGCEARLIRHFSPSAAPPPLTLPSPPSPSLPSSRPLPLSLEAVR